MTGKVFGQNIVAELPPLLRYALMLTRDRVAAEDLVQETVLFACEAEVRFEAGRALRPWLFSILHNRFISGRRRQSVEHRQQAQIGADRETSHPGDHEDALRLAGLMQSFEKLPQELREVLHLIAVEGLSYRDAATILMAPIGTVMSRLSRARALLRDMESLPLLEAATAKSGARLQIVGEKR